ncbi:hypothetical protein [Streptomyces sp. NPDC058385]|uniref:hypothetical protein n=1 Tax=Streptomyces sp. NPDC058385 TaxID=3346473 RepID=UPI00365AE63B
MYGHGTAPPSRNGGTVLTLRVLFAAMAILSCGVLSCAPLFRVAFLRGKWFDWTLAWVALPVSIGCFAVVGSLPETDHRTDAALAVVLLMGVGAAVHFLIFDIRRQPTPPYNPYATTVAPPQQHAYGYPQPHYPQAPTPAPGAVHAQPTQTAGLAPTPVPAPAPAPQAPPPHRIDQVRAELDELSDYLRKQEGGQ